MKERGRNGGISTSPHGDDAEKGRDVATVNTTPTFEDDKGLLKLSPKCLDEDVLDR